MGKMSLLVPDFVISFMWVSSGVFIKKLVHNVLGALSHEPNSIFAEIIKCSLSILNMFFFAFLAKITKGATYNPLTVLSDAISGDFSRFFFTVAVRIPAQVLGSIVGVRFLLGTFPGVGLGPRLTVDIHRGALTEGLMTYAIVTISLGLYRTIPGSFFRKTWISSVSKVTLNILGSDLTGGCMNPASVMGWAYARGDHITKEHTCLLACADRCNSARSIDIKVAVSTKRDQESQTRMK